jgi:uncharacterized membrane protein YGL010W
MALMSPRTWPEWLARYAESHQHPVNRLCHTLGIPLVVGSLVLGPFGFAEPRLGWVAAASFGAGWAFQLVGHAFEGKPPEFTKDWRFLFVGVRWWFAKLRGKR